MFESSFSSSLKRNKNRRFVPSKLPSIDEKLRDAMNACFICRGPAKLFRRIDDHSIYLCSCQHEGVNYYSIGHEKIEDREKVEKNMDKFENVHLNQELKTNCKGFCNNIFERTHLLKAVGLKRAHVCECRIPLIGSTYYVMEGDEVENATIANKKQIEEIKLFEKENKLIELYLKDI